ncbi:MAG: response regulator [FCB group bacterium]|nr:response regulator [FCB group bacterium]
MKKVILVADDSSTVRKFVKFSLQLKEFDVITAEDGMDALEKMSQTKVDLAIVDLNMPNMDGYELIETLRGSEDYEDLPVVILSSEGSEAAIARGKEAGADAYMNKPFDVNRLQYTVAKFLDD